MLISASKLGVKAAHYFFGWPSCILVKADNRRTEMNWENFVKQSLFEVAVPFLAGGIVFLLVGFGTGLIGTTGASNINIAAARVNGTRHILCRGGKGST